MASFLSTPRCTALAVMLSPFLVSPAMANIWNNGPLSGDTGYCDTQNPCGGSNSGFWVADNFSLASPAVVSGFTYYDFLSYPFEPISDYEGSDWAISIGDPASSTPIASGFNLGSVTFAPFPFNSFEDTGVLVTVTGLNVPLNAGTYWLSIQTQEANGATWTRGAASGNALPGYEVYAPGFEIQLPPGGVYPGNPFPSNTAFTVEAAPEPGLSTILGVGLAGLLLLRRRISG